MGPAAVYAGSAFLTALAVFGLLCLFAHLGHSLIGRLPNAGIWRIFLFQLDPLFSVYKRLSAALMYEARANGVQSARI